jgi:hypothetical protein
MFKINNNSFLKRELLSLEKKKASNESKYLYFIIEYKVMKYSLQYLINFLIF